jgi:hypothetical protein
MFVGVRSLTDRPGDPFPFTRSFVAEWCDVTPDQAKVALVALRRAGVLHTVGTTRVGQHDAYLYVVGGV